MRISDDRTGDALGVERQEQDCRALAERKGWPVGKVYRENDTSAFTRRKVALPDGTTALRVVRPAFRELLDDITSGAITALVAYDLDRVARDPRDLEDLIDAVEQAHLPTAAVTGDIDLSTDNGVFMARMMVNVANKSSRDTSRRVRRKMLELAEAGRPTGGARPFGYTADRMEVQQDEADDVRWMHGQVAAGRSLRSLALDLSAKYPERRWDVDAVNRILTSPRYVGLREHRGVIIGPAAWPAIVGAGVRDRTLAVLADREHPNRAVGGPRRYLLTGLLFCGRCGERLYPRRNADRQRFGCLPSSSGGCGGSLVVYEPAEEFVVRTSLLRAEQGVDLPLEPDDPTDDLRAAIAKAEQEQRDLGAQLAADPSAVLMLQSANKVLARRISDFREQVAAAARPAPPVDPDIADRWPDLDPAQRRLVLDRMIERVTVAKGKNGGPRFDPTRLTITWR